MAEIEKLEGKSLDVVEQNIEQLIELFPSVFSEGKIQFNKLEELLGHYVVDEEDHYNFTWHGKRKAGRLAQTPSTGTLRPCKEESVHWDTTENLFIEGDNLEVLKLLQKSYHRQVKMIYIDPPYNTGKEFIYPDKFQDNLDTYLKYTGQVDDEGKRFSSNSETSGRYHTNWLSMIYPRLKLARNLLREDGAIFMSIDDHEIHNLRAVCNQVFGEHNFLACIANVNNPKGRSDDNFFATAHDYILVYAKNIEETKLFGFEPDLKIIRRYNKTDQDNNKYREIDLRKTGDADRREDREQMFYYFYFNEQSESLRVSKTSDLRESEIEIIPLRDDDSHGRWRWGFKNAEENLDCLLAKFMPNRKIWGIFEKDFLDGRPPVKPTTAWTFKDVNSERGSEQFIDLGFDKEVFQRPKPLGTLKRVIEVGTLPNKKAIVLDFFAGSGGFAQAAYLLESDLRRSLNVISVQLPEKISADSKSEKTAYDFCVTHDLPTNIASISKERIRRASKKIKDDNPDYEGDLGFKVFKLDSSNIKRWNADFDTLEQDLVDAADYLIEGRSDEDVLYELCLKLGLDLSVKIEEKTVAGEKLFILGRGYLVVCLSDNVTMDLVNGIGDLKNELEPEDGMRVVFKDDGFKDDVVKTNALQTLKRFGIDDIKSL